MCHLRHRLRLSLFRSKVRFHSQYIQVFVFLTIPWFTKSVTSWWVLVQETGFIEYIFWTTTPYFTKLGQLIYINKDNNFQESFKQSGGLGLSSRSFSIQQPAPINYSITIYLKFQCFIFFFQKANKGHLKMVNFNYQSDQISLYCHFSKIMKEPGTNFQSPGLSKKTCY